MAQAGSLLLALPPDVLQRLLAGIPLADHKSTASACRTFRAVIADPQFPAVRRGHGFNGASYLEGRGIVVVKSDFDNGSPIEIRVASQSGVVASISGYREPLSSTTDGTRLFFSAIASNSPHPREDVFVVEASPTNPYAPIQWRRFATLPPNQYLRSIEWYDGCLYAFGGFCTDTGEYTDDLTQWDPARVFFNSLHVFNEASGLWEDLPPMPHACIGGTSAVIGDCLYLVGGFVGQGEDPEGQGPGEDFVSALQIYDFASQTWRLGAAPPDPVDNGGWRHAVFDGKLVRIGLLASSFYDPQSSDAWSPWTVEETELPWQDMARESMYELSFGAFYALHIKAVVPHQGRLVVFLDNGAAFERAADGSWSRYEVADGTVRRWTREFAAASVLLG